MEKKNYDNTIYHLTHKNGGALEKHEHTQGIQDHFAC